MALSDYLNKSNLEKAKDGFSKYIVAPAQQFGVAGFVFDVEGETTQTSENEITDHYVEDNSAVQDHIATRPKTITLSGYVGELVFRKEDGFSESIRAPFEKLVTAVDLAPKITDSALQLKNNILSKNPFDFDNALDNVTDIFGAVKNLNPTASKQQQAYLYFDTLRKNKVLLSVQTPFEFIKNMAVESIVATQSAESKDISSFTITLKEIRKAQDAYTNFSEQKYSGRNALQRKVEEVKGKAQGVAKEIKSSILKKLWG